MRNGLGQSTSQELDCGGDGESAAWDDQDHSFVQLMKGGVYLPASLLGMRLVWIEEKLF